ncbi:phospholipase [Myxococcus stipitatus]|uniref:alpha/beta hydrolase n=1 Tax=Myxococcus stipitatus TaxID=83455 RepID=UPI001F3E97E1|nr:phospholipase [Myxococcus stipitatus]MCE9667937.1 phospholipase [Myxococcus stipitatus]
MTTEVESGGGEPALDLSGRLTSRPGPVAGKPGPKGLHALGLGAGRDGFLFVPESYDPTVPAALLVTLHGAMGNAGQMVEGLRAMAEAEGFLLLSIDSRGPTWDHKMGPHGQDLGFIDRALAWVFARHAVDPERIVLSGFSDGASYALSLGVLNGDLFPRIIAFAPRFVHAQERRGTPRILIVHGQQDSVLPLESTGQRIFTELVASGFDARLHPFPGGHSIPAVAKEAAVAWLRETDPRAAR